MNNAYKSLTALIEKKAIIKDPVKFQSIVNIIFHDHESEHYDKVHREMWESLPQQYQLLANDIIKFAPPKEGLTLLDIGCGTGLAAQMLLNTVVGSKISKIHLLDTSGAMLKKAKQRFQQWHKNALFTQGDISQVTDKYDIIIVSSVLHHIPDITDFLANVAERQQKGGLFITIHDPSADAIKSDVYKQRCQEYQKYKNEAPVLKHSIIKRTFNKIGRLLKPQDYIQKVNDELLKQNVIKEALTAQELWSITDIHVEDLPYSASNGISKELLTKALHSYTLLSYRTYAFYGILINNLVHPFKDKEQALIIENDLYGRNFSSVWIKNS